MTGYKLEGAEKKLILLLKRVDEENKDMAVWAKAWGKIAVYRSKDGNKEVTYGEIDANGQLIYQSADSEDDL